MPIEVKPAVVTITMDEYNALKAVANTAAMSCVDLTTNLNCTYAEYMDGTTLYGDYLYILNRHGLLHHNLRNAGYTEKNPVLGTPCKPADVPLSGGSVEN